LVIEAVIVFGVVAAVFAKLTDFLCIAGRGLFVFFGKRLQRNDDNTATDKKIAQG
jgi:hypothetical protein